MLYVYQDTDWAAEELTRKDVLCITGKHDSQACSDAKQSRNALSSREAEPHGIVRRLPGMASSVARAGSTARVDGWINKGRDDVKANLSDLGTDQNGR